jgi:uncharacterized protein (TIRG00374 family)
VGAETATQEVRRYQRLVPFAVGASLLTLVAISVYYQSKGSADLVTELRRLELWALPAALGLHLAMQSFWALRLRTLGAGLGAPVTFAQAHGLVTSGLFAAAVTPGRIGGEPWRIAMLVRRGASGAAASRTILADRAVDMVYFLLLGVVAVALLPAYFGETGNVRALGVVAVAGLVAIMALVTLILVRPAPMSRFLSWGADLPRRLLGRAPRDRAGAIQAFFAEVTSGLRDLVHRSPGRLWVAALCSVLLWTCELSVIWVVLQGFGFDVPYMGVYLAGIVVVMVASVPALPGGTGLAELAALVLLTPLADGLTPAFLVVWRGMTYYMDLLLGGLLAGYVARPRRLRS